MNKHLNTADLENNRHGQGRTVLWLLYLFFFPAFSLQAPAAVTNQVAGYQSTLAAGGETAPSTASTKQVFKCKPGPWGDLEYFYTYLEPPEELIRQYPDPPEKTTWVFSCVTRKGFLEFIDRDEFRASTRQALKDSAWKRDDEDLLIYPPDNLVLALNYAERSRIMFALNNQREFGGGIYFSSPFNFPNADLPQWLSNSGVNSNLVNLVERTQLKLKDGYTLFSDVSLASRYFTSDEERVRFLQVLSRKKTMVVRLKITKQTDLLALEDYWTMGYKQKNILPILKSVFTTPGVETLDLVHLLPPTPRKCLYTFPTISDGLLGNWRNCYWTAANFFRVHPNDRFIKTNQFTNQLQSSWESISQPYRLGDILVIYNPENNQAIHACVYIADDIVYTKNGSSPLTPWMFTKQDLMVQRYNLGKRIGLQGFRIR